MGRGGGPPPLQGTCWLHLMGTSRPALRSSSLRSGGQVWSHLSLSAVTVAVTVAVTLEVPSDSALPPPPTLCWAVSCPVSQAATASKPSSLGPLARRVRSRPLELGGTSACAPVAPRPGTPGACACGRRRSWGHVGREAGTCPDPTSSMQVGKAALSKNVMATGWRGHWGPLTCRWSLGEEEDWGRGAQPVGAQTHQLAVTRWGPGTRSARQTRGAPAAVNCWLGPG